MSNFRYLFRRAVDWFFKRSVPMQIMRLGGALILASILGGLAFNGSFPWNGNEVSFSWNTAGAVPVILAKIAMAAGMLLIAIGLIIYVHNYRADHRKQARSKIIAIELRGLRDTSGSPVTKALPENLVGRPEQLLIDIRQNITDGQLTNANAALERVSRLSTELTSRFEGLNRGDISIVFGGLAPVPMTFLAGILVDDEGPVTVLDWDRHNDNWRELDADDGGLRFDVSGVDDLSPGDHDAAILASVSYAVDRTGVASKIGDMPAFHLSLSTLTTDGHWTADSQREWTRQFLEMCKFLGDGGVKRIHLFLAAPSSVVFAFGRKYDTRNLPEIIVYQYQREETPPYPWGVRMPHIGIRPAEIV